MPHVIVKLVTRQIALSDVTDTLERMTRFETVGFEVITRFAAEVITDSTVHMTRKAMKVMTARIPF